ncbi:MAG TPA: histidine phosphatase family protein [Bellilinea sp.]|nr:histidine phosphatase family protein [Bellilinea sp.]
MRLLLIRHGDNDSLHQGILPGRLPGVHLNENGRKEAGKTAELLRGVALAAIYASPLERTLETAQIVAEGHEIKVREEAAFIENYLPEWEGKKFSELAELVEWKKFCADPISGGNERAESAKQVQERAVAVVERMRGVYGEKDNVVVVSHGDVIRGVICHYLNLPLTEMRKLSIETASVSVIALEKETSRVDSVNCTAGLDWLAEKEAD